MESIKKFFSEPQGANTKKLLISAVAISIVCLSLYKLKQAYINPEKRNRNRKGEAELISQLKTNIQKLGKVEVDLNTNIIAFESFLNIYALIRHYSKARIALRLQTEKYVQRRRKYLQTNQMEEYWKIVEDQNKQEDQTYNEISQIVLSELNMKEDAFTETQHHYLMDPKYQQMFYQFQMQQEMQEVEKIKTSNIRQAFLNKFSKNKVQEMLEFSEELKIDAIRQMEESNQNLNENGEEEPIHQQSNIMLMQTYMADKLYEEFEVEEDEFNRLIAQHNLFISPAMQDLLYGGAGNVVESYDQ